MSYQLADGSRHTLTSLLHTQPNGDGAVYTVATDEPGRTGRVFVHNTSRGLRVDWLFDQPRGIGTVYEALSAAPTEHYLGSGSRSGYVDLRGHVAPLKVTFVDSYFLSSCNNTGLVMPFVLSSVGYGFYLDTANIGRLAFPGALDSPDPPWCRPPEQDPCPVIETTDRTQICIRAALLSYEIYAGSPDAIMASYTAIAGRPALPPPEQFGLLYGAGTNPQIRGDALLAAIDENQRRHIPLGGVYLDDPWEVDRCIGSFRFDLSRFPDPARMIRAVHARGVRFVLWVSPYVSTEPQCRQYDDYAPGWFAPGVNENAAPPPFDRLPFVPAPPLSVDLTNPAAQAHFEDKLAQVFALGVDGVEADRADETDFEHSTLYGGPGTRLHNVYPVLFAQAVTTVLRELRGEGFTTMFRAGYTGTQSTVHGMWGADEEGDFAGLRFAIRRGLSAAVSGYPIWGSDTGGYSGLATDITFGGTPLETTRELPTPQVFIRWAQFSAVSPVFEISGTGQTTDFWATYPQSTVDLFRKFAILHYELFPYHYALAERAAVSGEPILRPLGYQYPEDPLSWTHDLQVMIGPHLLAVPVADDSAQVTDASGGSPVPVYLPSGQWVDVANGEVLNGPDTYVRRTPLSQLPLYMQRGSAIPFNLRAPDVWADPWGVDDLDRPGRTGWLYAPASGVSTAAGAFGGSFVAHAVLGRVDIDLSDSTPEAQILVLSRQEPLTVAIDGRPLREAPSLDTLRAASEGWIFNRGEFPGVMVKMWLPNASGHLQITFSRTPATAAAPPEPPHGSPGTLTYAAGLGRRLSLRILGF